MRNRCLQNLVIAGVLTVGVNVMPQGVAAQSQPYVARGQEPGWSLTIDAQRITLSKMGGERFEAATPARRTGPDGDRYDVMLDGKAVQIRIATKLCRDIMSGMPHPDSVTISGLGPTLNGCGGAPRALLGDAEWTIAEINASPVQAGTSPTIQFIDDAVAGNGSCNRYRGAFTLTGEGLRIEKLASTMMACPEPAMQQEHALLRQLEATQRFDIRDDGALVLFDDRDRTLIAVAMR